MVSNCLKMNKFNIFPDNWKEISNEEFTRIFFMYLKDQIEFRQMMRFSNGEPASRRIYGNMFSISGTKTQFPEDGLGVALFRDGYSCKFAKFGNDLDWSKFESDFAAQFRGDNS